MHSICSRFVRFASGKILFQHNAMSSTMRRFVATALTLFFTTALIGCGGGNDENPADFVVLVKLEPAQADQRFVIRLTKTEQIAAACAMISNKRPAQLVFGNFVEGDGGFNHDPVAQRAWSWHLVPDTVTFVDIIAEVYDATPSFVEQNKAMFHHLGKYGPWASRVERELRTGSVCTES